MNNQNIIPVSLLPACSPPSPPPISPVNQKYQYLVSLPTVTSSFPVTNKSATTNNVEHFTLCSWPTAVNRALHRQVLSKASNFIRLDVLVREELDTIVKETQSQTMHRKSVLCSTLRAMRENGMIQADRGMKFIEVLSTTFK